MTASLASDTIYSELRRRIVFAELSPGAEIDIEAYAKEFKSSRTPVRDALRRLDHDGLVDVHPRAGCRVSRVSMKDLVDILDVREAVSPMASRLAALRATPAEIDELEAIAENGYAGAADVKSILSASQLFHCRVAKLSHNPRLHEITEHTLEDMERIMRLCGKAPMASEKPLSDHHRLLQAFRERDADAAAAIELAHIQRGRGLLIDLATSTQALFDTRVADESRGGRRS
ncbi:MAG: GntR family transcriptional regulator [Propionicimonas sp.]|uniref:GntR family transcriptional regulator n=1 Tax=Propionicimonas sp. TaxID=1955623 RepID=UPI002B20E4B4|nr:GntR family transcriptional regulator [Propionicimonas sp.]MEA4944835.1 GntR family transcriptional regulator [Propionicimonas sp.]MEA5052239.1 GntR family transcriptional regulator [Propionicimonas sp.]MEA5116195.1 GntR family transcriptional regulator [Propionicimonas sp.]